jgi:hypothetical protein
VSAAEELVAAAVAAVGEVEDLTGVYDGKPLQAGFPHASVDAGAETDWGHKSGAGRELRLAVTIRDKGERPERLRRLMAEAQEKVLAMGGDLDGWRVVTLFFLRSRIVMDRDGGWAGVTDYRVRMLSSG